MGRPGWLFPQDTRVRAGQYAGIILGFGISREDASRGTVHVAKIRLARPSGSHAEGDTVIVPQADLIPVACVAEDSPWNSSHWDPPADAIRVLLHVPARMLGGVRPGSEDGTWQIGTVNGFTTGIPEDGEWCLDGNPGVPEHELLEFAGEVTGQAVRLSGWFSAEITCGEDSAITSAFWVMPA